MNRQHTKPGGGDSNDASPLSLLVHAADAQNQRPAAKRTSNGSSSRPKPQSASGTASNAIRREVNDPSIEEQLMQRQVAAARAEAAFQQQQGLLPHLPRGIEAELYQQSTLAAAAQQQQQHAAAMAIASDLRTAVAAAQLRQAAQLQNHDLLLARAAQQQLGGFGAGGLDQLQELELQRLEELERSHLLAQAARGHAPPRLASPALAARQLEMQEAQLRQEQLERLQQEAILDRVSGRGASEGLGAVHSASAETGAGAASGDNTKDSFQKTPGSVVVPCRARGMPMDHNFKTAYFVIPENVEHGEELICSYFACRNAGIKFRYCTYCKVPVAKRNFRKRHRHGFAEKDANDGDDDSQSGDEVDESPGPSSADSKHDKHKSTASKVPEEPAVVEKIEEESAEVADKPLSAGAHSVSENEPSEHHAPSKTKSPEENASEDAEKKEASKVSQSVSDALSSTRGALESESKRSDVPTSGGQSSSGRIDEERERRWATLLAKRPPTKDGSAMSGWLMEVLAVSDLDTPLNEKAQATPSKPDEDGVPPEQPDGANAGGDPEANKTDGVAPPAVPSQSVLIKKKRPLAMLLGKEDFNEESGDSGGDPSSDGGGGFAEWKDRKKHKGLIKKGLTGSS